MRPRFPSLLLALALFPSAAVADEIRVAPKGFENPGIITDLDSLFADLPAGTTVRFDPGDYMLTPKPYLEETCGNCEAESTRVEATYGLRVTGRGLFLIGPDSTQGEAVIHTNAGYGVLIEDCRNCNLEGLTITGGVRDTSGLATDAGIVVKRSSANIVNCTVRDNIGDPAVVSRTVVGIIGIAGREGSLMSLRGNRIVRNSWDGVALYHHSQAVVEGNWIDGVDLARGQDIGGGRGVGIGMTWDAFATARGNVVRHYWKGIGVFVDAQATVEENIVEHVATWGMTLWDAGVGRPSGAFRRNVIYDTGACGVSIVRESTEPPPPGQFVQNVLVKTGEDPRYDSGEPYCYQTAIAEHAVPPEFSISANLLYDTRQGGGGPGPQDLKLVDFNTRMTPLWTSLENWPRARETDFWKSFGPKKAAPAPPPNPGGVVTGEPDSLPAPSPAPADTLSFPGDESPADPAPPDTGSGGGR